MTYKERQGLRITVLLALVGLGTLIYFALVTTESQEMGNAVKTAVAFYKGIEDPTPATEEVMELKEYRMYGYPALVYGSMGIRWGVEKLQGASEGYQVEIPFWCYGKTEAGADVKLRRKLLVQVAADPAADGGMAVTRFKFHGDEQLSFIRQFITWLLWMFLFRQTLRWALFLFAGGMVPGVAFLVTSLMGLPIQIYASYLCFGTVWGAVVAMVTWIMFQGSMANANKRKQS